MKTLPEMATAGPPGDVFSDVLAGKSTRLSAVQGQAFGSLRGDLVRHDVSRDAGLPDPSDENRLTARKAAPDPVVMDKGRPWSGREVGDQETGAAIGIGDDRVDLAVAEIEPQGQRLPRSAAGVRDHCRLAGPRAPPLGEDRVDLAAAADSVTRALNVWRASVSVPSGRAKPARDGGGRRPGGRR